MNDLKFKNIYSQEISEGHYDLVVSALGYESRAIAISEKLKSSTRRLVAIGFDHNNDAPSYLKNRSWFQVHADAVYEGESDERFVTVFDSEIERSLIDCAHTNRPCRIAIDVSCLNRFRIASAIA